MDFLIGCQNALNPTLHMSVTVALQIEKSATVKEPQMETPEGKLKIMLDQELLILVAGSQDKVSSKQLHAAVVFKAKKKSYFSSEAVFEDFLVHFKRRNKSRFPVCLF